MDESPERQPENTLRETVLSLEAEYRAYRRAADRYHARADSDFSRVRDILAEGEGGAKGPTMAEANTVGSEGPAAFRAAAHPLTARETQVLKLIAAGHSTKQAAFILGIGFKTAVGHRTQLMKKLGIHDTASLVRFAIRAGLVEL